MQRSSGTGNSLIVKIKNKKTRRMSMSVAALVTLKAFTGVHPELDT